MNLRGNFEAQERYGKGEKGERKVGKRK